ncbi:MAG: dnaJ-class molecular chaperone [Phenylobacterium sp.]|uniref:J domain-containing protein n=1 Tax=Phenylobacterium sp. TaxID=1871053 RepID=UPI00260EBF23|nr:molecular chaperone DnaJ [Phenylobacterium sp.]MDB5499503.1 dnaJ-class molecular chaperone [Phenylobacterium sp.]
MLYLALGAALLWFLVGLGRGQRVFKRREWRLLSGAFALAAFAGAAYVGIRGGWEISIVLVVLGLWLLTTTRIGGAPTGSPRTPRMSLEEARSMLGVGGDATPEEIQAAYTRLMRLAHPDKGGTTGLATQLNAARDRLLKG